VTENMNFSEVDKNRVLRQLDSFEEHFWLMERVARRGHVLAAEISGQTKIENWHEALRELQKTYPLLQASIGKVEGERPFFYSVPERLMPLRVEPLTSSFSVTEAIEKQLSDPFTDGEPLTRSALFHQENKCVFLIASHHASLDGKSHLFLLHDLLCLLTERASQKPQPLTPSVAELFGRDSPEYRTTEHISAISNEAVPVHPATAVHVTRTELSSAETEALVANAKLRGASVHSTVLTALALAGLRSSAAWRTEGIRCLSPVDIRPFHGLADQVGQLVVLHRCFLEELREDQFWEIAARITSSMRSSSLCNSIEHFLNQASSLVEDEHSPQTHLRLLLNSGFVHDLMLTSYGSYQVSTRFRGLQLDQVFTAGFAGGPDTQKFSTMTVNGSLGITHVAHHPFPEMLQTAKEILTAALATSS
jgi:NRPS condensation-like uncharacterized protein